MLSNKRFSSPGISHQKKDSGLLYIWLRKNQNIYLRHYRYTRYRKKNLFLSTWEFQICYIKTKDFLNYYVRSVRVCISLFNFNIVIYPSSKVS